MLTYAGTSTTGAFTFTGRSGEVITLPTASSTVPFSWVEPDGTTLTRRALGSAYALENNRGFAILFEAAVANGTLRTRRVCAVNLTQHYLPSMTACPSGSPTATIVADTYSTTSFEYVTSITMPDAGVYNYQYSYTNDEGVVRRHLNCVKNPGQSSCVVANTYDVCDGADGPFVPGTLDAYDQNWTGSRDRVTVQGFATGETLAYSYPAASGACRGNSAVTMTDAASAATTIAADWVTGTVTQLTDPLSRTSAFGYVGSDNLTFTPQAPKISTITSPEGDVVAHSYDERGNILETRRKAKPGSGMADIVTSAAYPSACANPKTCNKPISITDPKGNVTDFVYSPDHGGVLSESGPAVNGVRPQKRYGYTQRYAWTANGAGGFAQAASPVWLLTSMSFCRTSTATGNPSAPCTMTGDEVLTTYDYGPDSGPNNLLLRGTVVTADGQSHRSCQSYDAQGNKISETGASANLPNCN